MIQNSAYVNLLQIYLELNQDQKDTDRNNNDTNGNICCDHHHDETITREQEHFTNESEQNCSQASRDVENKTEGDCIITTTCTSQPDTSQPKDDHTQETVETLEQVSGTGKLMDGSTTVPTPAAAVNASETQNTDQYVKRPMNAFLMFCKRHRKLVTKHFVVENREISVILGKWWGVIPPIHKRPYQQLAREHRRKLMIICPNFKWYKRVLTRAQVSHRTIEASANTSLVAVETDQKNEPDDTISDECLEAAETLVSFRQSFEMRPLAMFKLADESDMGSLRKLYTVTATQQSSDRAVPVQTWQLRCDQSSRVPCTSDLSLGGPPNQAGEGPSSSRAPRACKGKRYHDIISHMLPRAQSKCPKKTSKKSQKTAAKKQLNATGDQPTNADTADPNIKNLTPKELQLQTDKKLAGLPLISIDHFLIALDEEKNRKKPSKTPAASPAASRPASPAASPSSPKKRKTELSPAPNPQDEAREVVNAPIGTTVQPASSGAAANEARALVQPTCTKLVGSSKRKSPKERITHHPQSEMEERQTILICHMPDAKDGGICHARAGLPDNQMTFH